MRAELPVSTFPSKKSKKSRSDSVGQCDHVCLHYGAQVFDVQDRVKNFSNAIMTEGIYSEVSQNELPTCDTVCEPS